MSINWVYLVPVHKTYGDKLFYKNSYVEYLNTHGYRSANTGDSLATYPAIVIYEQNIPVKGEPLPYAVGDIIYFMTSVELRGFDLANIHYHIIPESCVTSAHSGKTVTVEAPYKGSRRVARNESMRFKIKKVIFNDPATIVFWEDGSKTVVKCQYTGSNQHGKYREKFDKEKGLAMCFAKKAFGNSRDYYEVFKQWTNEN